jgi:hypothetical protein
MDGDDRDYGDMLQPQSGGRVRQPAFWAGRGPRLWTESALDGGASRAVQRVAGSHAVAASGRWLVRLR